MKHEIQVINLGVIDYEDAYRIQKEAVEEVLGGAAPRLYLCEHPAVLTLGRMTKPENVLWTPEELAAARVPVVRVDRGGDVTLHAPGQLVAYPIMDLNDFGRDLHRYLRCLEDVAMAVLRKLGVTPRREPGQTGVWVGPAKVVSLGIGVKRWVTYHGMGINVHTDLKLFGMIRPCGLNVEMNSISHIIGRDLKIEDVATLVSDEFLKTFGDIKGVCHGSRGTT